MATSPKPAAPTAEAIDRFCGRFDDLFCRLTERTAMRHYLIGLLLPRERNKMLTELAALVPALAVSDRTISCTMRRGTAPPSTRGGWNCGPDTRTWGRTPTGCS